MSADPPAATRTEPAKQPRQKPLEPCQLHKIRNVADKLPDHHASTVGKRMRAAYHADSALMAQAQLEALAKELERTHPGAAASIARNHSTNVKNWQNGNMALRWCAAGMIEAGKQFRRVNGHLHLPALRAALNEHVAAQTVGTVRHDEPVIAA